MILHLAIGLIVVLLIQIIGLFFFDKVLIIPADRIDSARIIFHLMTANAFVSIISVPYDAVINARENMFLYAILGLLEAILKLIVAIYLTYSLHDKLISYGILILTMV